MVLSGAIREEAAVDLLEVGARDVVMKSNLRQLVPAIRSALEGAETGRLDADAQRAPAAGREHMALALDAAEMMTWERDPETLAIRWAHGNDALYGLLPSGDGATYEDFLSLVHPDDRERVDAVVRGTANRGGTYAVEYRVVRPDGHVRWLSSRGQLYAATGGAPARLLGVVTDVTEQRVADRAVYETEERLRIAVEAGSMLVWERDLATGEIVFVAGSVSGVYGLEAGDVFSTVDELLDCIEPADREAIREKVGSPGEEEIEYRLRGSDGTLRWISTYSVVVPGADGSSGKVVGVSVNTTERKEAEHQHVEAELKYRALVENIPAVTYIDTADGSGTTVYVSLQIESLLGIPPEEWMAGGLDIWLDCIHPEDRESALSVYLQAMERREIYEDTYRAFSRDGTMRWFRSTARIVDGPCEEPALLHGVMLDITASRSAQEELEVSCGQLARSDEQRRYLLRRLVRAQEEERLRMAADIHDDSVQVLTALALRLELLRNKVDPALREALRECEETARRAITRLRHLIFELRPPALDRDGLATALRALLQQLHDQRGLETTLHDQLRREPDPDVRVILYRIVQEALANVATHAQASSVTVVLRDEAEGHRAIVSDDGIGFDVGNDRERAGHVGLVSMSERAQMSGGTCTIESAPGEGTSVSVVIPGSGVP